MKELLNLGLKIETMRAWGWYIRFIGPSAMKSKDLVNEMLKLPEQAFSDSDPQGQIAALVSLFDPSKMSIALTAGDFHLFSVQCMVILSP